MVVRIGIKPMVAGQGKEEYELEGGDDVRVLRERVSERLACNAEDVKLIFKGRFLKDGTEIACVGGLSDGAVVHAHVSSSSKAGARAPSGGDGEHDEVAPRGTPGRSAGEADGHPMGAMEGTAGIDRIEEMIRNAAGSLPGGDDPEVANELNRMLRDPSTMQQMMQMANNPAMQLEYMRGMDRALSNIESMPGGFNALAGMVGRHNAAEQGADQGARLDSSREDSSQSPVNPFDRLFAGTSVSNDPMPNPWQRGQQQTGGGLGLAGLAEGAGGMPELGNMPGLGDVMSQVASMSPQERERMVESMQGLLQQLGLADQGGTPSLEQMRGLMNMDGAMAQMAEMGDEQLVEQAAQIRRGLQEMGPAELGANVSEEEVAGMLREMRDVMRRVQQGDMSALERGLSGSGGLQAILNGMGGGGAAGLGAGGLGGLARPQQPVSEEELTEKNQQLQSMGFHDEQANRRALQMTNGNVHAAVDLLLSTPPSYSM
jgi:hypothetical protein